MFQTPTTTQRTRMIGMTDQKIRPPSVEGLGSQTRRAPAGLVGTSPVLFSSPRASNISVSEGHLEPDGPDEVRPQALVAVDRNLDVAGQEKVAYRVPLRPHRQVHDVIADLIAI